MDKLIDLLCQAIDPNDFRVMNFPSLIFLCGGSIDKLAKTPASVRHYIYNYIEEEDPELFKRIILAEEVNNWIVDKSPYGDILELETDLAGLVSAIPLFLEGAGSFSELGAFVSENEIREKLLVFLDSQYNEKQSFIYLGPIKKLINDKGKNRVLPYSWGTKKEIIVKTKIKKIKREIYEEIKKFFDDRTKTAAFDSTKTAHRILLMCDFIDVAFIVRFKEILDFFNKCGVSLQASDIKKYGAVPDN